MSKSVETSKASYDLRIVDVEFLSQISEIDGNGESKQSGSSLYSKDIKKEVIAKEKNYDKKRTKTSQTST